MKPPVSESRFDFRGGRNTAISPDLLNPNELVDATNARLSQQYGGFTKRSGSQRIHATALDRNGQHPILGITQWDGPNGKQVVAISRSDTFAPQLWYRDGFNFGTRFTRTGLGVSLTIQPTDTVYFATFRDSTAGAPLVLFIALSDSTDGANLGHCWKWDGTTATLLTGTNGVPGADMVMAYHTRLFMHTLLYPKTIWWSRIGDGTTMTTGTKTDGGSALVDVLSGERITALEVIGSSLLMATPDCIMRFTGHASDDIVIAQDTEGVSSEVGAVGPYAFKRFENVAAMYSERGPYAVTETYAQPMGEQLNPDWFGLDTMNLKRTSIEYNRSRKELLFALPGASDGGMPKTIFSQAVRLQAWQGPWTYPFQISCMCKYFDTNNQPSVLCGSPDGFLRLLDIGQLDDVLSNGTGGSTIPMTVEIPVLHFDSPGTKKALKWLLLQADLPIGSNLTANIGFDGARLTPFPITPNDNGEENYRVDVGGDSSQGFRCRMTFTDTSAYAPIVNGFTLEGWNYMRTT